MMKPVFQDYPHHVEQLIRAALAAADPAMAVKRHMQRDGRILTLGAQTYNLEQGRVFLISIGKAAVPMGIAAAAILGDALTTAILVPKKGGRDWRLVLSQAEGLETCPEPGRRIGDSPFLLHPSSFILLEGDHPVSGENSVKAATAVIELLSQTTADDLVLCLISGGASALFSYPLIPLADWQQLTGALLASGCTINEFNCVRRRLDRVKGGGLARLAAPAACASLILSDVVGNPLDVIGSGPTVPATGTAADALKVLDCYDVRSSVKTAVWQRITQTLREVSSLPEVKVHNLIVGDVRQAATAAQTRAAELGFSAQLLTAHLEGEAREVGRVAAAIAKDTPPGRCLILGGETTVTLRGDGRGGRNQELALSAAIALDGRPHVVIASFATDGEDGPTDAAGAIVTGQTAAHARAHNLAPVAYLDNNDSYTFFKQLDKKSGGAGGQGDRGDALPPCLIQSGATGTNVNDLLIILTYSNET